MEENELRIKERVDYSALNQNLLNVFICKVKKLKPNLSNLDNESILKMNGIINENGFPTLCGMMNFGIYPQYFSPFLDIVAIRVVGKEYEIERSNEITIIEKRRISGRVEEMLKQVMSFVLNMTKQSTRVNQFGQREDIYEYPMKAIREIILNALIHRDYSIHTENDPIRLTIFEDRIEVTNPGGLYGRLTLDDLGKTRSDIRNPFIASILEILKVTENRYSGIPTIYTECKKMGLMDPKFENDRGNFKVTIYNSKKNEIINDDFKENIKEYCKTPRSKESIAKHFGFDEKHPSYFIKSYILPLIEEGVLGYTLPNKPKSKNQRIYTKTQ